MSGPALAYGYDPARIVALRTRTLDAIEELRSIRCDDPLADDAVRVVRLMCRNLEESWMPLIDAIHDSRAMITWRRAAGITSGRGVAALARLVEQFGATSGWTTTTGLDELSDAELGRRLRRSIDRFRRAAAQGGDLAVPWGGMGRILDETARRLAADDGRLARQLWRDVGPDGLEDVVAAVDASGRIADLELLAGVGVDVRTAERTTASLATVLGAIATTGPSPRAIVVGHASRSIHLARLVADHADAFDRITLVEATAELVAVTSGSGAWASEPRVLDLRAETASALHAVATSPTLALQLLADPSTAAALATTTHLDDDAVEAAVAAALSAPVVDADALGDVLEVVAGFVAVSARRDITRGTRRGIALASGAFLPSIAAKLDARLPVDVAIATDGDEPATVVHLGTYDELAGLVGQVVDDDAAQLALGVVVGAFRADQVEVATAAITDRTHLDVAGARAQLSAALADVSRVLTLVDHAAGRRDALLAFRHGLANARATSVVGLLGSMLAWYPAASPLARRIGTLTTRGLVNAIGSTRPPTVPDTGLDADLAVDFLATLVALPLHDRTLRERLGLAGVDDATWRRLETLLDDLDRADDDTSERSTVRSRIRAVVDADPDLDAYVETIAATSGESALARP